MRELPCGTVTFLFTDVEGSTKLLHSLGAQDYADALAEHRWVIREACERHEGVEVDTQGDAFFFAFASALAAACAASEMTDTLASGRIQVRVGLHTGTPLLTEEGYVGEDVHFAARVAASGHGGQVVVSSATAALFLPSDKVSQGIFLLDLGEHRLKDVEGPVSIFQLGDGSFPPLKTISNTNLPRPASSFVGREAELAEVLSHIQVGARLVTLTGPGGSGKTRLAIEAAASFVPEYKAGVFWVGLAALRDPALVTETISQTLGAKDGLAEHIAEREMMLLLDNLEHVIEAAPELSSLLTACPNLALLVTSRELLRVQGEVEYPVPPLAEPEAVSLFCERAQSQPSEEIAELCARLDSLPLAVELAAARTKALSPAQILERLSQRLDLLKGGRDADARQQTLRATIEWSYDLLTEEEQQLFLRLSVFAGGCTLEAAEAVCDADLDTLQSLVEKSLLRFTNERYWMLETIREYASEALEASTEAEELHRRHAAWFLALAEEAAPRMLWYSAEWAERLEREHDNLRAALEELDASGDGERALELASALQAFWGYGHVPEARRRLERLLAKYETPSLVRARALDALAEMAYRSDDAATARVLEDEALELFRRFGDEWGAAIVLQGLGVCYIDLGDLQGARIATEESIELYRRLGGDQAAVAATRTLAFVYESSGDRERAIALHEANLREIRTLGFKQLEAATLGSLWGIAVDQGRLDNARELGPESLTLWREIGSLDGVAQALCHAAQDLALLRAKPETAAQLLSWFEAQQEHIGVGEAWVARMNEQTRDAIKAHLDEATIAEAWAQGAKLTADRAVELALAHLD